VQKVPETILKTVKVRETQRAHAQKAAVENVKRLKTKREVIFRRAEKYVSQYRKISADKVRAQKVAKTTGQVYVPAEAKVLFVVRIRGINGISPKPRKVLQLFRLRQINNGVFIKVNKATINMLRLIEPYVTYGAPTLKTIRSLVYKRGYGKVTGSRIRLSDNDIIEKSLGKHGIICIEDLIHEVYTVGAHFKEATNFLWPFKLNNPTGGWTSKTNHFVDGGDFGNREHFINKLIEKQL